MIDIRLIKIQGILLIYIHDCSLPVFILNGGNNKLLVKSNL